ncbi:tRNA (guanosine(46)-N7)-methyltransferase TrmB, partial [Campylobacter coli]|nr:tRNA (guanosine(46)-N7)-methyltransferase TrmB [Campylobacter coli]
FENFTLKKEDFFLHFENIYKQGESLLLKIAFGAFNKPEYCYLHIGEAISFVFKEPFKIQENLKAIKELKKSVKFHFNMKHFLEN